jgi:hypothetical protein
MVNTTRDQASLCWTWGPSLCPAVITGTMHAASSSTGPTSAENGVGGRAHAGRGAGGVRGRGQRSRGSCDRGRARRGRGGGLRNSGRGGSRGGYQGSGVALTAVEPGYRYFKKSFLLNPWADLERNLAEAAKNSEEIDVCVDDMSGNGSEEKDGEGSCSGSGQVSYAVIETEKNTTRIRTGSQPDLSNPVAELKEGLSPGLGASVGPP